jgi:hypothetical protein
VHKLDDAYGELKAFLAVYNAIYRDMSILPPDLRPEPLLGRLEKRDPQRAIQNVKTEVNRIVHQTWNWKPDKAARFEAALAEKGAISLSVLRKNFSKEYKAIVARGEIKDLVEYYLAKDLVSHDRSAASGHERVRLEAMMVTFEEAEVARFKAAAAPAK